MSINWVMLEPTQGFVRLPGEKPIFKSPPRTSLAITTPKNYPGTNPLNINSSAGIAYLTNQRLVYLPTKPTPEFQSFSAPLLNLHDSHVNVPWFGANAWQCVVQPVPGGNLPSSHAAIELKLTFNDGGAPDFHSNFERIKERLHQAVEAARDSGVTLNAAGFVGGVNMDSVHLEQLPTYEGSRNDRVAPALDEPPPDVVTIAAPTPVRPATQTQASFVPPPDAPPGYEETQHRSLQEELDRRLNQ
jgi:hypothetical protein